jgi:hypothetical protein
LNALYGPTQEVPSRAAAQIAVRVFFMVMSVWLGP